MAYMTRTPLRVSFFGGGTDYPEYFANRPGAVIGMAIDRYIYIAATVLQTSIGYNYRVAYSKLETVDRIDEIQHPVVRSVLLDYGIDRHLDISVMSDLPSSGGGLGSSSSFTVGFVNLIRSMGGDQLTKLDLAREAMRFERDVLKERVGVQDQLHASFGGLNRFDFEGDRIRISPVSLRAETQAALNESMVLIYTGIARRATAVLDEQLEATKDKKLDTDLGKLYDLVEDCVSMLEGANPNVVAALGAMLDESWQIKRRLSSKISSPEIDDLYAKARAAGAYGGKLCGAGGGGFLLMLAPPDRIPDIITGVSPHVVLPIGMDYQGSTVVMSGARPNGASLAMSNRPAKPLRLAAGG